MLMQNQTLPHIEESVETTEDKAKSESAPTYNNMDSDEIDLEIEAARQKRESENKGKKVSKVAKKMMKLKNKKKGETNRSVPIIKMTLKQAASTLKT